MNKPKITFGKIALSVPKKPEEPAEESKNEPETSGFKKFGKEDHLKKVEIVSEELEQQSLKDIMGFGGFGKKAKVFDITVSSLILTLSTLRPLPFRNNLNLPNRTHRLQKKNQRKKRTTAVMSSDLYPH